MTDNKSLNDPFENTSNYESPFLNVYVNGENSSPSPFYNSLSKEQQTRALIVASKIDVSKYENILQFGNEIQQALKNFTHNMLVQVQRSDKSPIQEVLFNLMGLLEKINPDDLIENKKGLIPKIFRRSYSSIQEIISHYNRLSIQIDRLSIQLQHAQKGLLADINVLNELYQLNKDYFDNINVYIAAGEIKKYDLMNNYLPKLEHQTLKSDDPMFKQKVLDLKSSIEWLDKRIYDLQISREIAIQTAPQIRMIQQTNQLLIEKIQTSAMTTIPLWQTQISLLLNLNHQRRAKMESRRLMDVSDEIIRKNAKMIKITANDSKKQKIISHSDIDLFKQTHIQLVESIEEILRVQIESQEKQSSIEANIIEIENK